MRHVTHAKAAHTVFATLCQPMRRLMLTAFASLCLACAGSSPVAPSSTSSQQNSGGRPDLRGTMSATLNTAPWSAEYVLYGYHGSASTTTVNAAGGTYIVDLVMPEAVGTYPIRLLAEKIALGDAYNFNLPFLYDQTQRLRNAWKTLWPPSTADSGTITVTSVSPSTIAGTFAFTAGWYDGIDPPTTMTVTNGRFTVTSYCTQAWPKC